MAETLGSLCDKLTIVKLKQYHSDDKDKLNSLAKQEIQLKEEIDGFLNNAISGVIAPERLIFSANKVYKSEGNKPREVIGKIGEVFAILARVNCELWHEQEKVYEFEKVAPQQKDEVIKKLALLNLERNNCIDSIDMQLQALISAKP